MKSFVALRVGILGALLGAASTASAVEFVNFSDTTGLTLNGNAAQVGNVLRLTPADYWKAGSAFSTSTISLSNQASFSTRFQFQITNNGGISDEDGQGADGITFVVQTVSNNVGGSGGGIGYEGIPKSVGVEFDTYNNGSVDDNSGNHLGIDIAGNIDSAVTQAVASLFNNGAIWTAWIDYNGLTNVLEVRTNQTGIRPGSADLSYVVDLASVLGSTNAYVGFTSATGAAFDNHDILNWEFRAEYAPIDVPTQPAGVPDAASTLPLLGLGLAGLALVKCRFAR